MSSFNYKKKKQELSDIIEKIQSNDIEDLEESIKMYKKAKSLIAEIQKYLEVVENDIEKVK